MKKIKYLSILPLLLISSCSLVSNGYKYDPDGFNKRTEETTYFENITSVNLDWVSGKVKFEKLYGDDQRLCFSETNNNHPLYYKVNDNELSIRYVESGTSNKVINSLKKDITIYVPEVFSDLVVSTINSDVTLDDFLDFENAKFKGVNGKYTFGSYSSKTTSFDFVNCSLTCSTFDCVLKSKMGDPFVHDVKMDFVNSSATLAINPSETIGYKVDFDGANNTFKSSLNDNQYEYGQGNINIDFNGVNSQLTLKRWDE